MSLEEDFDLSWVLDRVGQGVLIFGATGQLIWENLAAYILLGNDLTRIRAKGWEAAAALFNARQVNPDESVKAAREKSIETGYPIRFHFHRAGEIISGWVSVLENKRGESCLMIIIDVPDWTDMAQLVDRFRSEMQEAVSATRGHIALIYQTLRSSQDPNAQSLNRRLAGFARLIGIHMHRSNRFLDMLERMEDIHLGRVKELTQARRRKIRLVSYLEDFVEELDEIVLTDPETEAHDHRARLTLDIKENPILLASSYYLTRILRDVLRNAIMYSVKTTPIHITAHQLGERIQIDIIDAGYGIRKTERNYVFTPFKRARQPQILAEFGYGLSLYLCRHEVEAMNGRLWYESEEGIGTTFSIMLPAWDESSAASSSDTITP